jgi:4-amino-4-deoxy-L-arabinose transferase-like glycosyltransferase
MANSGSAPAWPAGHTFDRAGRLAIAGLIVLHLATGLHTVVSKSLTHDELWHLPAGLLNLRTGRFDFDTLNPPLTRMWAALPLWAGGVTARPGFEAEVGGNFVEDHRADFQRWYMWGRMFNLALSAATAILMAWWARRLFGTPAALLTTLLYCTCPSIVAHSSIVTPDTGLMLAFVATLCVFERWTESRTWRAALGLGVVLGLAQATKFTAVLLYPLLLVLWVVFGIARRAHPITARAAWWQMPAAIAISLVVLNAVYLFRGTGSPVGTYQFQSSELRVVGQLLSGAGGLPVPLPRDYLQGLDKQRSIMEQHHPVFLDGVWSVTGFSDYYPKTLLYKLPHLLQALCVLAMPLVLFGGCGARRWRVQCLLLLPVVLLLILAARTPMQLGIRYVLPVLPLLMLFAGQCGLWLTRRARFIQAGLWTVIAAACLASLRFHPHHLAYFNEYAGGPVGGRNHLLDSNIDWGQDLNLVRDFMQREHLDTIGLAYFGTLHPELIGIEYTLPPELTSTMAASWTLPPGWYAVSVNYVMGRPHLIHEAHGKTRGVDRDAFGYFRRLEPVARLGYSIDVYQVTEPITATTPPAP